jgi:hypothetical protein
MEQLRPLISSQWPTAEVSLATLGVRLEELAGRLSLPLAHWCEDGLGPSLGIACRLPSGRVFLLQELEYALRHGYAKGPAVLVDATDLVEHGVESLLAEILPALRLSHSDLIAVADRSTEEFAAELLVRLRQGRAQRDKPDAG